MLVLNNFSIWPIGLKWIINELEEKWVCQGAVMHELLPLEGGGECILDTSRLVALSWGENFIFNYWKKGLSWCFTCRRGLQWTFGTLFHFSVSKPSSQQEMQPVSQYRNENCQLLTFPVSLAGHGPVRKAPPDVLTNPKLRRQSQKQREQENPLGSHGVWNQKSSWGNCGSGASEAAECLLVAWAQHLSVWGGFFFLVGQILWHCFDAF